MKNICKIMLIGLVIFIGMSMLGGKAYAQSACYSLSSFPSERFMLLSKSQGTLITAAQANEFLEANQKIYNVVGKEVGGCGAGTMTPADGTIIIGTSKNMVETGAHMGIRTATTRTSCVQIFFECTTTETSVTPSTWDCVWKREAGLVAPITLTKVDVKTDPLCSVFESAVPTLGLTAVPAEGASGLAP
ncbi:MAG: hypothetical protein ACXWMO_10840 [Syntrophales bacterium]